MAGDRLLRALKRTASAVGSLGDRSGEGGIRTHGTLAGTRTFQARSFGHSDTSPFLWPFLSEGMQKYQNFMKQTSLLTTDSQIL